MHCVRPGMGGGEAGLEPWEAGGPRPLLQRGAAWSL